jgi:hypothetical protein
MMTQKAQGRRANVEHEDQPQHMLRRVMQVGQLLASAEGRESGETPGEIRVSRAQPGSHLDGSAGERKKARTHLNDEG